MADLIISQPMTFTVDVKTGLVERPQRESLMRGDRYANRIIVELVDGSQPFDITGVTVKGEFCKPPNGDAINLPGEAKGNVAEVQLTDQCYTAGGHYEARVILVLDEVERTVLFISGDVLKSGSGNAAGDEPGGTGSGLPAGGTEGQVLVKVSSAQGAAIWKTLTAADVGALPAGGTAVDADKLNGKDAEYYATAESVNQLSQQKVDKASVVNNFTTTEAGFVADARAIKALYDRTDVCTNIPITPQNANSFSKTEITCRKMGRLVEVNGTIVVAGSLVNYIVAASGFPDYSEYVNTSGVDDIGRTTALYLHNDELCIRQAEPETIIYFYFTYFADE